MRLIESLSFAGLGLIALSLSSATLPQAPRGVGTGAEARQLRRARMKRRSVARKAWFKEGLGDRPGSS